jgi:hypothetical protein
MIIKVLSGTSIFQDYDIRKFSELISTIQSSKKFIMLEKKNEPLKGDKSKVSRIREPMYLTRFLV